MPYSQTVRSQAAVLHDQGFSRREIANQLNVSSSTVHRWVSPAGRASYEAWKQRLKEDPELMARHVAATRKAEARPEAKERKKQYMEEYRRIPEVRRRDREYQRTTEYKERKRKRENEYRKKRKAADPGFRVLALLRVRAGKLLRGEIAKCARTEELLGISVLNLTRQWDVEYGPGWQVDRGLHIDHIRPCASFDLSDPAQQRLCFNYRNLQLLPATENKSKGDRWDERMELEWTERMKELGWEGRLFQIFKA